MEKSPQLEKAFASELKLQMDFLKEQSRHYSPSDVMREDGINKEAVFLAMDELFAACVSPKEREEVMKGLKELFWAVVAELWPRGSGDDRTVPMRKFPPNFRDGEALIAAYIKDRFIKSGLAKTPVDSTVGGIQTEVAASLELARN